MDMNPELPATIGTSTTPQTQSMHQSTSAADRPLCSQPGLSPSLASSGVEADLAAASAVVAAIMNSKEQGGSIDMDLLVKILKDPLLIGKLTSAQGGAAATTARTTPNIAGLPSSGTLYAPPLVSSSPLGSNRPASGVSSSGIVGLFPDPGLVPVTSSVQLMPTRSLENLATPFSSHMLGKLATPSVSLPSLTSTADILKPVNRTTDHLSSGGLPSVSTLRPQPDIVTQLAPMASISSREPSLVSLPSTGVSMPVLVNQVRPPTNSMAYPPSTAPALAGKEAQPTKDINYYKNLVRQHGADENDTRQEMHDSLIGIRQNNFKDLKPAYNDKPEVNFKTQKPCIYFNSSRGCRNGSNCPFQHDTSSQWGPVNILGSHSAKRAKLGPEIKGRTLI